MRFTCSTRLKRSLIFIYSLLNYAGMGEGLEGHAGIDGLGEPQDKKNGVQGEGPRQAPHKG